MAKIYRYKRKIFRVCHSSKFSTPTTFKRFHRHGFDNLRESWIMAAGHECSGGDQCHNDSTPCIRSRNVKTIQRTGEFCDRKRRIAEIKRRKVGKKKLIDWRLNILCNSPNRRYLKWAIWWTSRWFCNYATSRCVVWRCQDYSTPHRRTNINY